jgi:hypothetical protein
MANKRRGTDRTSLKFSPKLGILLGFIIEVITTILFRLTDDQLQHWILQKEHVRKQLLVKVGDIFKITPQAFIEEKEQWRKFYQKHFSLELNFLDVVIPEKPLEGTWRLIIIAQGLILMQVYKAMSTAFKSWKYADDLDKAVTKNIRDTKNAYALWVRDGVEPDEKYLGKSTNQADPNMTIGVTLLERMIHEMTYFDETGKHLDIKGITFCTGSRDSDGDVPCMSWSSDSQKVRVHWCYLDYSRSDYGLREAIS